jgi:ribosomal protein L37E
MKQLAPDGEAWRKIARAGRGVSPGRGVVTARIRADLPDMAQTVECLRCGKQRDYRDDECPRCGYVGWAPSGRLDEHARRLLRERPPTLRRIRSV